MTGYGRAEFNSPSGPVQIEMKTTNHRYFEYGSRLPYALVSHDEEIRKIAQERIKRGKLYISITAPDVLFRHGRVHVDDELAKSYHTALKHLSKTLGLKEKVNLNQVIRMPDVIIRSASPQEKNRKWKQVKAAVLKAFRHLDLSRQTEGTALKADLLKRSQMINDQVVGIKKKKLEADISEELVRLASHIGTFQKVMRQGGEVGRKIDFFAQEMIREINTLGAKCNNVEVAGRVIEVKTELEKIREQAQNIE
jgi:uncharacterized protein (TIGR00255 family)